MKGISLFRLGLGAAVLLGSATCFAQGRLILVNSAGNLFEVNPFTAAVNPIGNVSANAGICGSLTYDRRNDVLYLSSTSQHEVFKLDLATGNATLIGPYSGPEFVHGIEFDDANSRLFGIASATSSRFFSIDKGNGFATMIGATGLATFNNLGYDSLRNELFATDTNTNTLWRINRLTGAVAPVGPMPGTVNPSGLAYDWRTDTMFLIDNATSLLYRLNTATGGTAVVGALAAGNVLGLAYVDPTPVERLIAVDSSRALFEVNPNTGAKTPIGTVTANAGTTGGLAYDRQNDIVYLTSTGNDSVYTLDVDTGTATLIGAYGDPAVVMHGIEFDDSSGKLYGESSHNGGLYNLDKLTGVATLIGTSGLTSFTNLGYDSIHNVMFATNSSTDSFYVMNRATGAATLIGALGGPTNPNSLAFDWTRDVLYMADNNTDNLYTINRLTGAANLVGSMGAGNNLGLAYIRPLYRRIRGHVDLQDYLAPVLGRAVQIEIYPAGGVLPLETHITNLNAAGDYILKTDTLAPGNYDIYFKASHWLRRARFGVAVGPGGVGGVNVSLINADGDNDNEVGIGDYALLSAAYNSVLGDPNFNTETDFNGDDSVDIADYAILSANYGLVGD